MNCINLHRLVLTILLFLLVPLKANAILVTVDAGQDFIANELGAEVNPNGQWRYGFNTTLNPVSMSLIGSGFRVDSVTDAVQTHNDLEGYLVSNGGDFASSVTMLANTGASPITLNFGSGNLSPLSVGEMLVHPGSAAGSATIALLSWTAPLTTTYSYTSFTRDLDPFAGDGVSSYAFGHNGVAIIGGSDASTFVPNASGVSFQLQRNNILLNAGDTINFAVANNGNHFNDSTGFFAQITYDNGVAVPEPPFYAALLTAFGLIAYRRYKLRN